MRLAIVEDESSYAEKLRGYAEKYGNEHDVPIYIEVFHDGIQIVEKYKIQNAFDVIFMDIEMKQLDGMNAAGRIREIDSDVIIIYITNLAQFAVRGYEVEALDFLVKPVEYCIFETKMIKAQNRIQMSKQKFLIVRSKKGLMKLYTKEIAYIEVQNHTLTFHTMVEEYTCTGSLKKMERELKPLAFVRCHACYLVHLSHVQEVTKEYVTVSNGDRIMISNLKRKEFMKCLTDFYGGGYNG